MTRGGEQVLESIKTFGSGANEIVFKLVYQYAVSSQPMTDRWREVESRVLPSAELIETAAIAPTPPLLN